MVEQATVNVGRANFVFDCNHWSRPFQFDGYTDLCMRTLWVLDAAQGVLTGAAEPVAVGRGPGTMVSFGEGDDGELYVVDHGGTILRVVSGEGAAGG